MYRSALLATIALSALREGPVDYDKYTAIDESDCMPLKFRKPE